MFTICPSSSHQKFIAPLSNWVLDPCYLEYAITLPLFLYILCVSLVILARPPISNAKKSGWTAYLVLFIVYTKILRILFFFQQKADIPDPPPPYLLILIVVAMMTWCLHYYLYRLEKFNPNWKDVGFWFLAFGLNSYELFCKSQYGTVPKILSLKDDQAWVGNGWTFGLLFIQVMLQGLLVLIGISIRSTSGHLLNGYQPLTSSQGQGGGEEVVEEEDLIWHYFKKVKALFPYMWPKKRFLLQVSLILSLATLVLARVVNLLLPLQYKRVVDSLGGDGKGVKPDAVTQILLFILIRLFQGSGGFLIAIQNFLWIPVGQYISRAVSVKMFTHLHNLSLSFHLNRKTGEILRVQDRGVNSIVTLLRALLHQIFPIIADLTLACVYFAVQFDLYFASIVLVTMTLYIFFTVLISEWRTKYRRDMIDRENETESRAVDSLLNFETVKYYGAEGFEVNRFDESIQKQQAAEWKSQISLNFLNTCQSVCIQAGMAVGCLVCVGRVVRGEMTVGDVVLYLTYLNQLYVPLNFFGTIYQMIQRNFIDMEKMLNLFSVNSEIQDLPEAGQLAIGKGTIAFENVYFAYDPRKPILKNISFTVPGGSTVAIVGESGVGKSTLLRLLFRFYDVTGGRILVDGQDLRHVTQASLRQSIGVVPQDTVLFHDTVRYNIRYGKVGATDKQVEQVAETAQIHQKILSFPEGYETRVGERGLRLSGGEKQRVAIARTLLKNPPIVLLDEATSALDTTTERQIQVALREMTANRTTLIIAHRLSTVVHADLILVMKEGEIIERGNHQELLTTKGEYYGLWMKQQEAAN